ncbi:MAG: hypothetical protein ACLFP1_09450 [Candidatus Goldiibacteriota bacterium]
MRKKAILIIGFIFIFTSVKAQTVEPEHFLKLPGVNGVSGLINNPGAYTAGHKNLTLGIHNFMFKANYGIFDILEAGVFFNFGQSSDLVEILKGGAINIKANILKEKEYYPAVSSGVQKIPFNMGESHNWDDFRLYAAASKSFSNISLTLGIKNKLIEGSSMEISNWEIFADIAGVVDDTIMLIAEYDGEFLNAGAKISLNYNIAIDVFLIELNNTEDTSGIGTFIEKHFRFGITYLQ